MWDGCVAPLGSPVMLTLTFVLPFSLVKIAAPVSPELFWADIGTVTVSAPPEETPCPDTGADEFPGALEALDWTFVTG
jgi:hypothetical protein